MTSLILALTEQAHRAKALGGLVVSAMSRSMREKIEEEISQFLVCDPNYDQVTKQNECRIGGFLFTVVDKPGEWAVSTTEQEYHKLFSV